MPKYTVVRKWDVYKAWSLFPNFVYKSINTIKLNHQCFGWFGCGVYQLLSYLFHLFIHSFHVIFSPVHLLILCIYFNLHLANYFTFLSATFGQLLEMYVYPLLANYLKVQCVEFSGI